MSDELTAAEQQAADRTIAAVEALRADSNRRLAAEMRDPRTRARRRENVMRAYWKSKNKS